MTAITEDTVACRDAFGEELVNFAKKNKKVVALDADLASSTRLTKFQSEFPDRFFQIGVAEQNMIGVAAGLAIKDKIPVCATFATFISRRACDQVAMSVAHSNLNVKLVGAYSGLVSGNNGATHQAIEDIAIMRAIPNMTIVEPADDIEMRSALPKLLNYEGPVYLRVTRDIWPRVNSSNYNFVLGRSVKIKEGKDISLMASGMMVSQCMKAAELLAKENIEAEIINIPTIKPIDGEIILESAKKTGAVVVAENHNIIGGLGSAVSKILSENYPVFIERVGLEDCYGECGSNKDLLVKYDMDYEAIFKKSKKVLEKC